MNTILTILYIILHLSCGIVAIALTLLLNEKMETQPLNQTEHTSCKSFNERFPTHSKKMSLFISLVVFGPIAIVVFAFKVCAGVMLGVKDALAA